jgi:transketolase
MSTMTTPNRIEAAGQYRYADLRTLMTRMDDPQQDRFLLSKGHGLTAYYAVLVPGVEISSGSLGHGLPIAVGVALGQRIQDLRGRTYVLVGDAELHEGTNHEAIAYAGATGLVGLTAIVVDNQSATHGWPGGIATRFSVHGWPTATVDGCDHEALAAALTIPSPGHPHVVVAVMEPKE